MFGNYLLISKISSLKIIGRLFFQRPVFLARQLQKMLGTTFLREIEDRFFNFPYSHHV